jgi:rhodanese-related sulfurtransferase
VILYPAHGAGSSCGKNLGSETFSTIGEQKRSNYALLSPSKEAFIKDVTEGLATPPSYFPINAKMNKDGYESLDALLEKGLRPLSVSAFKEKIEQEDVIILDTRFSSVFTEGFVPGSISIGLDGRFAEWAGSLLPFTKHIVLVTEPGKEKETIVRLARVGFDKIDGYLAGSFPAWVAAGETPDMIIDIEADELAMDLPFDPKILVVDVRKQPEYADGHLKDAVNIPLDTLTDPGSMANFDETQNIYVHCAGGYRSVIASSLIKREGFHNIRNVIGGWSKIKELPEKFTIEKEAEVLN